MEIRNKGICPVCKFTYTNMLTHLMKMNDEPHKKYLEDLNKIVDELILTTDLYTSEIVESEKLKDMFISKYYVGLRIKEIEPNRKNRVLSTRRMGINNPVFKQGVIDKISKTVTDKWIQGTYKDRINGMLGVVGENHPNYKPDIHTSSKEAEKYYYDFLKKFEDVSNCKRCDSDESINIHHVDEDHTNILPSNLEPLCIPCHGDFHFSSRIQPYVTIGKKMSFAAAHKLPHHLGKCENWHGHEWVVEVCIRKRIDPATMMVMDFKDLKTIMKRCIIDVLDHNTINDIIEIPTAENILVWCWEQLMFEGKLKGIERISLWESPDSCAILDKVDMLSVFKKKVDNGEYKSE